MILEVDDRGRLERIAVVAGDSDRVTDERRLIGGYRLNASGYENIWFDKAFWDVTLIAEDMHTKIYRLTRKAS